MPREESYTIAEPGAGDVTDGSVDYYPMDWEIVRRAGGPADGKSPEGRAAAPRCGGNSPRQTDDAGGYEMTRE